MMSINNIGYQPIHRPQTGGGAGLGRVFLKGSGLGGPGGGGGGAVGETPQGDPESLEAPNKFFGLN